jgi:hypothetical protein
MSANPLVQTNGHSAGILLSFLALGFSRGFKHPYINACSQRKGIPAFVL